MASDSCAELFPPETMLPIPAPSSAGSEEARYHHGDLRRALVTAAVSLLTETQDWGFSLREVARRAGVSHNAPYNHFASKQDLLAAVAAAGYDLLRTRMQEAMAPAGSAPAALKAIGNAYVRFGRDNPAHYRLMFGTTFSTGECGPPPALVDSSTTAKGILRGVIQQGIAEGSFAVIPPSAEGVDVAVLAAWSLVHGLTLLLLDGIAGVKPAQGASTDVLPLVEQVLQTLLTGLCVPSKTTPR